uniref:CSON010372 protein n=1 Tax=Culicoides sonorensis TaxID=179676 RepID=A0A336LQ31_CULSO
MNESSECRLCLKSSKQIIKITVESSIVKAIQDLFNLKLFNESRVTNQALCIICHTTIESFYKFYNEIKSIQAALEDKAQIKLELNSDFEDSATFPDTHSDNEPFLEALCETDLKEDNKNQTLFEENQKEKEAQPEVKFKITPSTKKYHKNPKKRKNAAINDDDDEIPKPKKPRKVKIFYCDICGRDFKKYNFVKAHILQKHLNIFEHVCNYCGKTSFDKSTLKRHIDSVHLKIFRRRRDICPDCGAAVVALKLHRRLKHGIGEKKEKIFYTCDICAQQFTRFTYLKRHILRKHLNRFDDKCPFCQKCFYNRMSVERHMQSQHPDQVPENIKKKRLLESIRSPCDLCDKVFHRRANYLRHRRTVHKDEEIVMPFKMEPVFKEQFQ